MFLEQVNPPHIAAQCVERLVVIFVDTGHVRLYNRPMARPMLKSPVPGERFGRLTVLTEAPTRANGVRYVQVSCNCGVVKETSWSHVFRGVVVSCGCAKRQHNMVGHPAYETWRSMRARCGRESAGGFRYYGARGVRVCERWQISFEAFWADMGRSWRPGLTLERIDNDGHYKPGNCRWATREEQARNTRRAILVDTPKGRLPLKQAARAYGINYETFRRHYHQGVPHRKAAPA